MIREDQVEKILDELEEEFAKANMPVNDKLTLFAKISNAIYKCAEQEPCSDAISRQAVIDAIKKWANKELTCMESDEYLPDIIRWINSFPSVVRENRTAKWVLYRDYKNAIDYPQCNKCGVVICIDLPVENLNYCPNCGAKMEVEE